LLLNAAAIDLFHRIETNIKGYARKCLTAIKRGSVSIVVMVT